MSRLRSTVFGASLGAMATAAPALACTSLTYTDANGNVYFGRTLELNLELPYQLTYFPKGQAFSSQTEGDAPLDYQARYAILGVAFPLVAPGSAPGPNDLKIMEGVNEAGLTFSLLAYPSAKGPKHQQDTTEAILEVTDLGTWALARYATVEEVKAALQDQPIDLDTLQTLGGVEAPFHYVMHDKSGASIVIKFNAGAMDVYDNPVGVMTNGPEFTWHLTNLNNYTHLTNLDQSAGQFGDLEVRQPDSGIATAMLPSSNTSVDRFVRAVYYSNFAEKAEYSTEYTSWTSLTDLARGLFYIRPYEGVNYAQLDLSALSDAESTLVVPLAEINASTRHATQTLLGNAQQ